jgi:PilZ domain
MEKRRHARAMTAYSAKIMTVEDTPLQIECTVADLSQGGARLSLRPSRNLPNEFRLSIENGVKRLCKVVWKRGNEVGVAFQRRFGI